MFESKSNVLFIWMSPIYKWNYLRKGGRTQYLNLRSEVVTSTQQQILFRLRRDYKVTVPGGIPYKLRVSYLRAEICGKEYEIFHQFADLGKQPCLGVSFTEMGELTLFSFLASAIRILRKLPCPVIPRITIQVTTRLRNYFVCGDGRWLGSRSAEDPYKRVLRSEKWRKTAENGMERGAMKDLTKIRLNLR